MNNGYMIRLSGDELADIEESLTKQSERAHNQADAILADESKSGEVRASQARARRQHGNRLSTLAKRIHAGREALWRR